MMDQLDLLGAKPPPPDPGGWTELVIEGRRYRYAYDPGRHDPLDGERWEETWERFRPPKGEAFSLEFLGPEGHWRRVRFYTRIVQAWNLVRGLPGMPGAEPPPSQESEA